MAVDKKQGKTANRAEATSKINTTRENICTNPLAVFLRIGAQNKEVGLFFNPFNTYPETFDAQTALH